MSTRKLNSFFITSLGVMILFIPMACIYTFTASAAGLLSPKDGNIPPLSIQDHKVNVIIQDGYAITTIEQTFANPHDRDLEAVYSFPIPERAAVAEFTMWIDGKPVVAEVMKRDTARDVYTKEKEAGRDAGLTEQQGNKTFDISLFPVRASQPTSIRMVYIQPIVYDHNIASYVYPLEEGGVDEEKIQFWTSNDTVVGTFSFDMHIRSAAHLQAVRAPSHPSAAVTQVTPGEWTVHMDNMGASAGQVEEGAEPTAIPSAVPARLDTDIVVYFRLPDTSPPSLDLVTYKPLINKPGVFMLTLTPGDDLAPITAGADWVFVLDLSGSMQGKYGALAEGVEKTINRMGPDDRFRIIAFSNSAWELTNGYVSATERNKHVYTSMVASQKPGGSTNLYDGLSMALAKLDADRPCAILLVTDGVANVGETNQRAFLDLVSKRDVRLFTFIMGNSANRPLLTAMTGASGGFSMAVSNSDDIIGKILQAKSKVTHQALNSARLNISGIKIGEQTPEKIGSVYRGQSLTIFGRYYTGGPAQVKLSAKVGGKDMEYQTSFVFPEGSTDSPELLRLWAYARIAELKEEIDNFGEKADIKTAIEDLAVEHGLVTNYTSMVVVREEVFQKLGVERRNKARRAVETSAQTARQASPVQNRRADSYTPMFTGRRANLSSSGSAGAGAADGLFILTLPFLVAAALRGGRRTTGRV
ncbi:MAG: VIT and VWA domain-containing protein [Nitrospinota bacterium]|nr:VIT and VWA domain-containing protein [Nitrospinota bacterium]